MNRGMRLTRPNPKQRVSRSELRPPTRTPSAAQGLALDRHLGITDKLACYALLVQHRPPQDPHSRKNPHEFCDRALSAQDSRHSGIPKQRNGGPITDQHRRWLVPIAYVEIAILVGNGKQLKYS